MTAELDHLDKFDFQKGFNLGDRSEKRIAYATDFINRLPQILPVVVPNADLSTFDYPTTGMNGVVFMVDSVDEGLPERLVFKANLDEDLLHAQALAMRAYAGVGIRVPEVTEIEATSDQPYYLHRMNYIDRPLLSSTTGPDRIARGLSFQMGELLARGHIKGHEGFGSLDPTSETIRGTHHTFEDHIRAEVIERRLVPLVNAGVFGGKLPDGEINAHEKDKKDVYVHEQMREAESAMQILARDLANGVEPVLDNVDFSPNNIMGGESDEPLVVIDPKPKISHPLLDLANTLVNSISYTGNWDEAYQIMSGYDSVDKIGDSNSLDAAMYLMIIYKLHSFWKKGKTERCDRLKGILENIELVGVIH